LQVAEPKILAVVVSFNGLRKTVETLDALIGKVDYVHVVDNASHFESLELLDGMARSGSVSLERLSRNEGVGYALNCGVRAARRLGCDWLLTMDQDSRVDDNMLQAYKNAILRSPDLVCLTPNVLVNGRGPHNTSGPVDFAITSGNLIRMDVFDSIGAFDEKLFIDGVDLDFSLRVRHAGKQIIRVEDAILYHELGEGRVARGWLSTFHMAHSPLRRYYMCRNHLYIMQRYAFKFPVFVAKATLVQVLHFVAVVIYGGKRVESLRFMLRGVLDFVRGKTAVRQRGMSPITQRQMAPHARFQVVRAKAFAETRSS
jgi:rhamnosyltransferase